MKNTNKQYWLFQFSGWGFYILLCIFFYITIHSQEQTYFWSRVTIDAAFGLLLSHVMREIIKKLKVTQKAVKRQLFTLLVITFIFSLIYSFAEVSFVWEFKLLSINAKRYTFFEHFLNNSFGCALFLTIWNLIYFIYHYVTRSQAEQVDKIRLEALVKELELKTIKAHINPHFIFNALNSIRALVDENPIRARTAITELSNILRSSMRADKVETVPLQNELDIVKDYLALEQIRFEERLNVVINVDAETLSQPVPPMMVQTLVENAIKHGIGKTVAGGTIELKSDFKDGKHEIIIRNTGHINGSASEEGFGIASTKNRLQLLYGNKASFQIKDIGENEVEAKLVMPLS
jgi:two-component system LytT family sensor kinase